MKSGIRTSAFTINQGRFPRIVVSSIGVFNPISPLKQGDCVSLASKAMWDTGADFCCISQSLAKSLHLVSIGDSSRSTADGPVSCATYQVNLVLENGIYFEDVIVLEDPGLDEMGIDLLLGLAVINEVDFALTHDKKGNTVLSVSYPPSRTVDFRHR